MKILLASASRNMAGAIGNLLTVTGHETEVTYDGIHALESLSNGGYDVFLTEIALPRLSAAEVLSRTAERGVKIFSIGILNKSRITYEDLKNGYGMDVLLPKPFESETLLRLINDLTPDEINAPDSDLKMNYFERKIYKALNENESTSVEDIEKILKAETFGSVYDLICSINQKLKESGSDQTFRMIKENGYKVISI